MYYNLLTKTLDYKINSNFSEDTLFTCLQSCYNECAFSTFPYVLYGCSSKESIDKFKCGNCVALSIYLKNKLNEKNIKSFLIPASIPKQYSMPGYLDISHVGLAVPIDEENIYILDPAFYLLNPIKLNLNNKTQSVNFSKNIYKHDTNTELKNYNSIYTIISQIKQIKKNYNPNQFQNIPAGIFFCQCHYTHDINDKWNYYLIEILNPDKAISNFFLNIKKYPFMVSTHLDNNSICKATYIVKCTDSNNLIIADKNNYKVRYNIQEIGNMNEKTNNELRSFFKDDFKLEISEYFKKEINETLVSKMLMDNNFIDIND